MNTSIFELDGTPIDQITPEIRLSYGECSQIEDDNYGEILLESDCITYGNCYADEVGVCSDGVVSCNPNPTTGTCAADTEDEFESCVLNTENPCGMDTPSETCVPTFECSGVCDGTGAECDPNTVDPCGSGILCIPNTCFPEEVSTYQQSCPDGETLALYEWIPFSHIGDLVENVQNGASCSDFEPFVWSPDGFLDPDFSPTGFDPRDTVWRYEIFLYKCLTGSEENCDTADPTVSELVELWQYADWGTESPFG